MEGLFASYFERVLVDQPPERFSTFDEADTFLEQHLQQFKSGQSLDVLVGLKRQVVRYERNSGSVILRDFFYRWTTLKNEKRNRRRKLLVQTGLHTPTQQQSTTTSEPTIRTIYLAKLPFAYPPVKCWIADNVTIYQQWVDYVASYKLSDNRHSRFPIHVVDHTQLQLDVLPHESIIIRDLESREVVGMVIRNYGCNKELLDWASSTLKKSTEIANSVRVRSIYLYFLNTNNMVLEE